MATNFDTRVYYVITSHRHYRSDKHTTRDSRYLVHVPFPLQLIRKLSPLLIFLRLQPKGVTSGLCFLLHSLQLFSYGGNITDRGWKGRGGEKQTVREGAFGIQVCPFRQRRMRSLFILWRRCDNTLLKEG